MTLCNEIDPLKEHVRITGKGTVTMPEMITAVDQVAEDTRFRSHFTVILDIRDANYTAELADGDAFVAALKRREQAFQNRFVLLVSKPLQILATLFCLLAKTSGVDRMKCFTDITEAGEWCGLSRQP